MKSNMTQSICLVLILALCAPAFPSSSPTHNTAAKTAAQLAPEPFKSNWQKCRGAVHPDYMSDQPLGHENSRVSGLLYTLEAIRYLREGQIMKAMMTASARTHYISDAACIPHAKVWNPRSVDDVVHAGHASESTFRYLPERYQDYSIPFGDFVYDSHFYPLLVTGGPPAVHQKTWNKLSDQKLVGSMHGFFDRMSCVPWNKGGFPTEGIDSAENWSCYDREFYARWRAECIALDILDRETVLAESKPLRFVHEDQFKAVQDEEMRNMISAKIAYYRYLTVAADTELRGDIMDIFASKDPLRLMVQRKPKILIGKDAPWPLKRAAYLLAMELVRAKYRYEGKYEQAFAANLTEEAGALFKTIEMPYSEKARRLIVTWMEKAPENEKAAALPLTGNMIATESGKKGAGHIVLRGKDLQSTIHLIDYLLDLTYAPLNGRTPMEVMLTVFEREWAGMDFLEQLRKVPDAEVFDRAELVRPKNIHLNDRTEWTNKVHYMVWPNAEGESSLSGPIPAIWDLMLVDLPLPDGTSLGLRKE